MAVRSVSQEASWPRLLRQACLLCLPLVLACAPNGGGGDDDDDAGGGLPEEVGAVVDATAVGVPYMGDNLVNSAVINPAGDQLSPGQVHLVNESGLDIEALYMTECGASSWGESYLGPGDFEASTVLPILNMPAGCWDFFVVSEWRTWGWRSSVEILDEPTVATVTLEAGPVVGTWGTVPNGQFSLRWERGDGQLCGRLYYVSWSEELGAMPQPDQADVSFALSLQSAIDPEWDDDIQPAPVGTCGVDPLIEIDPAYNPITEIEFWSLVGSDVYRVNHDTREFELLGQAAVDGTSLLLDDEFTSGGQDYLVTAELFWAD